MSEPFLGEIRMFGFGYPPRGWASCDGAVITIGQNTALFALIGTYYGGNGKTTYALPNLQGRVPINRGQGPGLRDYFLGESDGTPEVDLQTSEMPAHQHAMMALNGFPANLAAPDPLAGLSKSSQGNVWLTPPAQLGPMSPQMVPAAGGSLPHNNYMPFLTVHFCIATAGIFPTKT